jgi:hypothetical protein
MSIEKLTKRLQGSIDFALDNEEDLDAASWNYQEGILITVNEAKLLLDLVKNCSIPDVVGRSEQLPKYELNYCPYCCQMTNHLDNKCQKH